MDRATTDGCSVVYCRSSKLGFVTLLGWSAPLLLVWSAPVFTSHICDLCRVRVDVRWVSILLPPRLFQDLVDIVASSVINVEKVSAFFWNVFQRCDRSGSQRTIFSDCMPSGHRHQNLVSLLGAAAQGAAREPTSRLGHRICKSVSPARSHVLVSLRALSRFRHIILYTAVMAPDGYATGNPCESRMKAVLERLTSKSGNRLHLLPPHRSLRMKTHRSGTHRIARTSI